MKAEKRADVAIIGAGIVGLALAYTAAKKGLSVVVFERNSKAIGASIRNFGLIWPIGQTPGKLYQRALASRKVWQELATKTGFYLAESGSLHLAYHSDELDVLEEFMEKASQGGYECELLTPEKVLEKSKAVKEKGLLGGLWSRTEMTVDPREAIATLPHYLADSYQVTFRFDTAITKIQYPQVETSREKWRADKVYVCSGADFETLYPEEFAKSGITKCKLQMMRTVPQPRGWKLGPSLCGGLTLRHYAAFTSCQSLDVLDKRILREMPKYDQFGIHVLLSQHGSGELIIGDSHEYGLTPEPFDLEEINQLIVNYLNTFATFPSIEISARWHGIYPKLPGKTEFIISPENGVTIVNGLSGAGMTLSFGLAAELLNLND